MAADLEKELKEKVISAIMAGDCSGLESLILQETGQNVENFRSPDGSTLLHLAVVHGMSDIIRELIKTPIDINVQLPGDGSTALHLASAVDRLPIVELLLEVDGIDDTIKNWAGQTALELSKTKPVEQAFRYARSRFIDKITKELNRAVQDGHVEKMTKIMSRNRSKLLVNVNTLDDDGETILHRAVKSGNVEIVKECLRIGADPFSKNRKGKLPLELTHNEEIRSILKSTPKVGSPILTNKEYLDPLDGMLMKYINFAKGFKPRFVVLEDGVLSYFKSKSDYPISCKGSLNLRFAKLVCPPGDPLTFELRTAKNSLFFKTSNPNDTNKWILSIKSWQKKLSGTEIRSINTKNPQNEPLNRSKSFVVRGEHYRQILKKAKEALAAIEQTAPTNHGSSAGPLREDYASSCSIIKDCLTLSEEREDYWQCRIETEEQQHRMVEESLKQFLKKQAKQGAPKIGSDGVDEFYDALDGLSISLSDEASEDISELTSSSMVMSEELITSDKPIETFEEPRIPERAVSLEDIEFIKNDCQGYPAIFREAVPVKSTNIPSISIWNIIKNAVGKDLTRIPVPVNFSEPISMLQRLAEDLEYADLLYMASTAKSSLMRLQYAAAFAMSPYSSTDGRVSKPFNPLLGETFELVSQEHGYRYIAEQVSHHPPISACHCESRRYSYYAEVSVKTKFWGKSLELVPEGLNHLYLKDTAEHISYRKVNTGVYNIILGKMWLDHYGTMKIVNHSTGEICELEYKPTGWRTTDPKKVQGAVYDSEGNMRYKLEGYWNKYLRTVNIETGEEIELWRRRPVPPWSSEMYNFTYFTMSLNELTPTLQSAVCPTDSRLRPDQRAMEEGRWDDANEIKVRLEDKQRTQRREWESIEGFQYQPRWFRKEIDEDTGEGYWKYVGGYWEERMTGQWDNVRNIYLGDDSETTTSGSMTSGQSISGSSSSYSKEDSSAE